jgi:hypothetical protein
VCKNRSLMRSLPMYSSRLTLDVVSKTVMFNDQGKDGILVIFIQLSIIFLLQ